MFGLLKDVQVTGKANTVINCKCDIVFNFVGANFFKNYPRWSPEVKDLKMLSSAPVKIGTLCKQVRVDQGNRSESTFKVTAFTEGRRVCFEGTSNPFRCDYVLEPVTQENSSRITFTFELLKLEMYMKPFEKLVRMAIQDGAEKTVLNIKKLVEEEVGSVSK